MKNSALLTEDSLSSRERVEVLCAIPAWSIFVLGENPERWQLMAAQANIALTDGEASPVVHTFVTKGSRAQPNGKVVANWREASSVNAEGDNTLVAHYQEGTGANGTIKHTYVLSMPVLETVGTNDSGITPPATKAFENVGVLEFRCSRRSTAQQRENLVKMLADLAAEAVILNEVENRETAW